MADRFARKRLAAQSAKKISQGEHLSNPGRQSRETKVTFASMSNAKLHLAQTGSYV